MAHGQPEIYHKEYNVVKDIIVILYEIFSKKYPFIITHIKLNGYIWIKINYDKGGKLKTTMI